MDVVNHVNHVLVEIVFILVDKEAACGNVMQEGTHKDLFVDRVQVMLETFYLKTFVVRRFKCVLMISGNQLIVSCLGLLRIQVFLTLISVGVLSQIGSFI